MPLETYLVDTVEWYGIRVDYNSDQRGMYYLPKIYVDGKPVHIDELCAPVRMDMNNGDIRSFMRHHFPAVLTHLLYLEIMKD